VLVERGAVGGQAGSSACIENYLGFPNGISGADLAERAREQACKFGAEILLARKGIRGEFVAGKGVGYLEDGTKIIARASICATGVEYRRLGLPNEERLLGAGLFYGAGASEAPLVKGEQVYIVGAGNSAGQAAMHLAPHAKSITMVVREDSLQQTLSQYLVDRIRAAPNIEVLLQTEVIALHGTQSLEEITLVDRRSGQQRRVPARWLFVCIGGVPHTDWAHLLGIVRDEAGYLVTGPDLMLGKALPVGWPLDRVP
jgi:thioredoxin reductase (NADPH)